MSKLTQEQKRVLLAVAHGFKRVWNHNRSFVLLIRDPNLEIDEEAGENDGPIHESWKENVPDYFGSLDAVHQLALSLRQSGDQFQWLQYTEVLFRVIWGRNSTVEDYVSSGIAWDVIHASAEHRAEALGQAYGLWKEGE